MNASNFPASQPTASSASSRSKLMGRALLKLDTSNRSSSPEERKTCSHGSQVCHRERHLLLTRRKARALTTQTPLIARRLNSVVFL